MSVAHFHKFFCKIIDGMQKSYKRRGNLKNIYVNLAPSWMYYLQSSFVTFEEVGM